MNTREKNIVPGSMVVAIIITLAALVAGLAVNLIGQEPTHQMRRVHVVQHVGGTNLNGQSTNASQEGN
jgi:hypothetical protein